VRILLKTKYKCAAKPSMTRPFLSFPLANTVEWSDVC